MRVRPWPLLWLLVWLAVCSRPCSGKPGPQKGTRFRHEAPVWRVPVDHFHRQEARATASSHPRFPYPMEKVWRGAIKERRVLGCLKGPYKGARGPPNNLGLKISSFFLSPATSFPLIPFPVASCGDPRTICLQELGSNGTRFDAHQAGMQAGTAVSAAGDVDGDGLEGSVLPSPSAAR